MSLPGSNETIVGPLTPGEKELKRWTGLRMAHEAIMLGDAQAVLAKDREAIERHRKMFQTDEAGKVPDVPSEDMADIRIGDEVHTHYHQVTGSQPAAAQQPGTSGMSGLAKAGLLAASVALGATPAAGIATWLATRPTAEAPAYVDNIGGVQLMPPLHPSVRDTERTK